MAFGFALNLLSAGGTAYAVAKGINDIRINIKQSRKAQKDVIDTSDVKPIQENFLTILNHTDTDTGITIPSNAEKFKIYCKALGVDVKLSNNTDTKKITLDKDKITQIQNALKKLDKDIRNSDTKTLFDVDINNADYISKTLGEKAINFTENPLGKPKEFFDKWTAKDKTSTNKQPDEFKNSRIANNVFILLQEQENKCIEAVNNATKEAPFEYKDPTTLELIKNATVFGNNNNSKLTTSEINQKMKLVHDSNTVLPVKNPSDLDTLQDGQKLSLDYEIFFGKDKKLTDEQKSYIAKNAKHITVTVKNNDELLNLTQKMNEIAATDSEVIHKDKDKDNNQTATKLNNTDSLLELLKKNHPEDYTTPETNQQPIDYIKKAVFLHHSTNDKTVEKQDLFKKIIDNKHYDAIEKSFPNFMQHIFPNDIKRYNDWDKNYLTDAGLKTAFEDLTSEDTKIDSIKDFPQKAKIDIIKQFLENDKFASKDDKQQFEKLQSIKKKIKDIREIETLCETKATTGKALDHILKQIKDKKYDVIKGFSDEAKTEIITAYLNKQPADAENNIVDLINNKAFGNVPNIKDIVAKIATEKKIQLNTDYTDNYPENADDYFFNGTKDKEHAKLNKNPNAQAVINFLIGKSEDNDDNKSTNTANTANSTISSTSRKHKRGDVLKSIISRTLNPIVREAGKVGGYVRQKAEKVGGYAGQKTEEIDENIAIANKYLANMFGDKTYYSNITNEQMFRLLNKAALEKSQDTPA